MLRQRRTGPIVLALTGLLLAVLLPSGCGVSFETTGKRLVVIGVDGMDPVMLQRFMDEGKMPNFQKLAAEGDFVKLGTSNPPQSPVAWSCFITGMDPGGHGVFDFLHRDPEHYMPVSSTQTSPDVSLWELPGKYQFPSPLADEPEAIRQGRAFWEVLEEAGVRAQIYRMPAAYPIQPTEQLTMSDMGTPDLHGGIDGTYFYFSTTVPKKLLGEKLKMQTVSVDDGVIRASIPGPPQVFVEGEPYSRQALKIYVDPSEPVVLIAIVDGESLPLDEGAWSKWTPVNFDLGLGQSTGGIVRFYLKEVRPEFKLYCSPIQIDPQSPNQVISTPEDAVVDLSDAIGRYYTQGLAEEVNALKDGVLDDGEFLEQTELVREERLRMLDYGLDRFEDGLFFFYLSDIDLRSHMMFRHITEGHPARDEQLAEKYKGAIEDAYVKVDRTLGLIRERVGEDCPLLVLSDHGFQPFTRKVHLNAWLLREGFLNITEAGAIDWSRTRAYAAGFNGIYLNMQGREGEGQVTEAERSPLLDEIKSKLLRLQDEDGTQAVVRVDRREEAYHGEFVDRAPDLLIGYNARYGASDATALINVSDPIDPSAPLIEDNKSKWSGNHLMSPDVVPGILLATQKIAAKDPWLADVTATMLQYFGIEIPPEMVGKSVF